MPFYHRNIFHNVVFFCLRGKVGPKIQAHGLKKLTSIKFIFHPGVKSCPLNPFKEQEIFVHNTDISKHNKVSDMQKFKCLQNWGRAILSSPTLKHQHPRMLSVTWMQSAEN